MVETEREVVQTQASTDGVESNRTFITKRSRLGNGYKVKEFVYLMVGITEFVLLMRLILTMLGANKLNVFASFIYTTTYPIVSPFYDLFNNTFVYGVARLEVETLVAMLIVWAVSWVVIRLIQIVQQ